ncbi:hypothetical protein NO1_1230 [Candidatus Termititenax aidoneus]|uniref:Uncharacterized protein n=1 Tax=Termititenax aidoneus TaxID=2218524 RepID=A0A388TCB1_TERA1|nr:hypothetical protein NO1_1230 [Candidatus Termititenax aidoneus]
MPGQDSIIISAKLDILTELRQELFSRRLYLSGNAGIECDSIAKIIGNKISKLKAEKPVWSVGINAGHN